MSLDLELAKWGGGVAAVRTEERNCRRLVVEWWDWEFG
jgi:uncharacterized protein YeaC (DUF1315 family)